MIDLDALEAAVKAERAALAALKTSNTTANIDVWIAASGNVNRPMLENAPELIRLARIGRDALRGKIPVEAAQWFYDATGDCERPYHSVGEVVEGVLEWCEAGEYGKPRLIEVDTAVSGPTIWAVGRALTDDEIEARGDDEPYLIEEYATKQEALDALAAMRGEG